MSKKISERLAEWRKGLVCLVPKETAANAMSITCHEKTLCDCKVLEIIATLETTLTKLDVAVEALEFYANPDSYDTIAGIGKVAVLDKDTSVEKFEYVTVRTAGKTAREALAAWKEYEK